MNRYLRIQKFHRFYSSQVKLYVLCKHIDGSYYFTMKKDKFELPNMNLTETSDPKQEVNIILKNLGVEASKITPYFDYFDEIEYKKRNVVYLASEIRYVENTKTEVIQRKTILQIKNEILQGIFKDSKQLAILSRLVIDQGNSLYEDEFEMKKLKTGLFSLTLGMIFGMAMKFLLDLNQK